MGNINLIITVDNPGSTSNTIRYGRIDNTSTPTYISIPNVPNSTVPYIISGVPSGQYFVGTTPIYADGRTCPEASIETDPCTGINSFNATLNMSNNIVVNYNVVSSLPKIKVNLTYPNGGVFSQTYNNGDSIVIVPPSGLYGDYTLTMQPVCDSDTGFFGVPTAPAIVTINPPIGTVSATAENSLSVGTVITSIVGIPGFSLSSNLTRSTTQTGTHSAFSGATISFTVTGTTSINDGVNVTINGSFVGRVNFLTGAGTYSISSMNAAATDPIVLDFNNNA